MCCCPCHPAREPVSPADPRRVSRSWSKERAQHSKALVGQWRCWALRRGALMAPLLSAHQRAGNEVNKGT